MAKPIDKSKLKCNRPRPLRPDEPGYGVKKRVVKACEGGKEKLIRFGSQGAKTYPPRKGESQKAKDTRKAWYARHEKNIAKGKMSAAYWSAKVKW